MASRHVLSTTMVAVVAAVMLLAGCAVQPTPLRSLTPDELALAQKKTSADWWAAMFPGIPRPAVEVRGYRDGQNSTVVTECIMAAKLAGVRATAQGYSYDGTNLSNSLEVSRVLWECDAAYPYRTDNPEALGFYSQEELRYLANYFTNQLGPCLTVMGYNVGAIPNAQSIVGDETFPRWVPYFVMKPQPQSASEWQRIDFRCPPPSTGQYFRQAVNPSF